MNAKVFFLVPAILAVALFSCSKDAANREVEKEADKTTGKLSVVATRANITYSEATIVLKEDDIESYNGKTSRIALKTALTCDDFFRRMGDNSRLAFYLGEELLFEAILGGGDPNAVYDEPVFLASCGGEYAPDKYFLFNGFPYTGNNPGWEKFIQYLSDAGKLEEKAETVIPPVYKEPDKIVAVITGDDVQSFNITTDEITFVDLTVNDLDERRVGLSSTLSFLLGEKLLFEALVYHPFDSRRPADDLVFFYYSYDDDKFYLRNGKKEAEWNTFIRYLTDAGKIVK
ncbi:MAG: hypothetical protein LBG96_17040 [Tannerella sp.]|jgi:hypothetical protein|nr:hypothetical protein [Tannerella sp.]